MNFQVDRYQNHELLEGGKHAESYLAIRKEDSRKVILKYFQQHYLQADIELEYQILQKIAHPAINKVLTLDLIKGQPALVYDYFDGITLDNFLAEKPLATPAFLPIATKLAEALSIVHQNDVVHCNLSTSNILINSVTKDILLIGFSQATGKQQLANKELITLTENNNNYWAPEQSGRMNRAIDHRADIYSLGIIFYRILAGCYPFNSKDSIGLLHNHIVKKASLLSELNLASSVPVVLSRIINKMIAKNPADRYQCLSSLIADIEVCEQGLESSNDLLDFDLGKMNNSKQLFNAGKLYGRETEISQIVQAYKKACEADTVLVLLEGEAGVGKSSLVKLVLKQTLSKDALRVTAKFDQFKHNPPFEQLVNAMRVLVKTVLAEKEAIVQLWRDRIIDALAENAQIIVELIPELVFIIGPQAKVQALPALETKARLSLTINQFIQVFCRPEQPLCIFLDDLQWADHATLQWLETVFFNVSYLLLIATCRKNDASVQHDLHALLNTLQSQGVTTHSIALNPLTKSDIREMLCDAMFLELKRCDDLLAAVFKKTRGNPFYFSQYLRQLQDEGVLWFDPAVNGWQYNIEKIPALDVSENVAEYLSNRISSLPESVQEVLKIAVCVGNQFNSDLIQQVSKSSEDVLPFLEIAETEGWIAKQSSIEESGQSQCYMFAHDRIQQTVWELFSLPQLQKIHLRIGCYMLEQSEHHDDHYLLQTVDHLNIAHSLMTDKKQRLQLASSNFKAGIVSKTTGDFELALSYIEKAMVLFRADLGNEGLFATIIRERAECEHLCGHDEQAKEFYAQAIAITDSVMEKAYIYELMIQFYSDLALFDEAYSISRTVMQMFEINLPAQFNPLAFMADYGKLSLTLRQHSIDELLDLPQAKDPRMNIIIRILSATLKVAYQIKPELCVAISTKLLRLCLAHGNTREAVVGYMVFGVIFQGAVKGNHLLGYKYGQLSLALLDKYDNARQRSEVNFVYAYFANSWLYPASDSEQYWHTAYKKGLETGDKFHTSCACCGIIQSLFMRGVPLDTVASEAQHFLSTVERMGSHEQAGAIKTVIQAIHNLIGLTEGPTSFSDASFNEGDFVKSLSSYGSRHFAHYYFINKMQCLFLQGQYSQALALSQQSAGYLKDSLGMLHAVEHHFYTALTLAKLHPQANKIQRYAWLRKIQGTEQQLIAWSEQCAENFLARRYLVSGEIYRLKGEYFNALKFYENANLVAEQYEQVHFQAMAKELAAELYQSLGQQRTAIFYQNEARVHYQHWGSKSYSQRIALEKRNTLSLIKNQPEEAAIIENESDSLDVATLLKSAEVIAKQRKLPELLKTLIAIVIENAGAQRGVLLLKEKNRLLIQAEAKFEENDISVLQNIPLLDYQSIPHSIINTILRTQESVIIDNAMTHSIFSRDNDVISRKVLSVLSAPLLMHGEVAGIIYLENNVTRKVFSQQRLALLQHLSGQICISIENALIYQNLEKKVSERTSDIEIQKQKLLKNNTKLQSQNTTISTLNAQLQIENEERSKAEKELTLVNKQLHQLTITDALTKISNRRHFDKYLLQECARQNRNSSNSLALLLCDIDFFKSYNDLYGHQRGDDCLIRVAQVLSLVVNRPSDLAARYGGEEFTMVLPHTDLNGAKIMAENIHRQLKELGIPHQASEVSPHVTLSIGIAISHQDCTPEKMIKVADNALYRVKESGRNGTFHTDLL